jgi:hypothetical protein
MTGLLVAATVALIIGALAYFRLRGDAEPGDPEVGTEDGDDTRSVEQ